MEWLRYKDLGVLASTLCKHYVPQVLSVAAHTAALLSEIPTEPRLVLPNEGPPSSMNHWYGKRGERLFTIESEASGQLEPASIRIYTGFLETQDADGDWTVLIELEALPSSIYISRPLFIESRNTNPIRVVYRHDPQGWKTPLYKAASTTEAERLLAYLKRDKWNDSCSIGEPEPGGEWAAIQGGQVIRGTGSGLNSALKFACQWSLRYAPAELLVRDITGNNKTIFVVSKGHVLDTSGLS
jgi:hypothetical protein